MVVMSTRLPAALPWATTSPPTVSTLPFRLDQLVCRLTWLLRIRLPTPAWLPPWSSQVPFCCCSPQAKAPVVERAKAEAARRILRDFMLGLLCVQKLGGELETAAQAERRAGPAAGIAAIGTIAAAIGKGGRGLEGRPIRGRTATRSRAIGRGRIRPWGIRLGRIGRLRAVIFAALAQRIIGGAQ